jgi:hypothetical protein
VTKEPEKQFALDAEYLSGHRFPYQEDLSLVEDVDLLAATPGDPVAVQREVLGDGSEEPSRTVASLFLRHQQPFVGVAIPPHSRW